MTCKQMRESEAHSKGCKDEIGNAVEEHDKGASGTAWGKVSEEVGGY